MTEQFKDTCLYQKRRHVIQHFETMDEETLLEFNKLPNISDSRLPTPYDYGMKPYDNSTACVRGYVMHYEVTSEERLYLNGMDINVRHDPSIVNGVAPFAKQKRFFDWSYEGLDIPLEINGGLRLGRIAHVETSAETLGPSANLWQSPTIEKIVGVGFLNGYCVLSREFFSFPFLTGSRWWQYLKTGGKYPKEVKRFYSNKQSILDLPSDLQSTVMALVSLGGSGTSEYIAQESRQEVVDTERKLKTLQEMGIVGRRETKGKTSYFL